MKLPLAITERTAVSMSGVSTAKLVIYRFTMIHHDFWSWLLAIDKPFMSHEWTTDLPSELQYQLIDFTVDSPLVNQITNQPFLHQPTINQPLTTNIHQPSIIN